ncbi:tripeptide aminopeptidase [Lachnospiraceae bacterium YSD2013]|nr:tripeptide aminopeptidase [Lachnospiraceae bacterium YSD2013]
MQRAYERFLNYVKIHTTSDEESGLHPSFKGEFDLAHVLVDELKGLGMSGVRVDEHCYVYAYLPATPGYENATKLGFIAHMDTSPEASGKDVKPVIRKDYDGSDIVLEGTGDILSVSRFPELKDFIGDTIITTDGTTLLGADDKAGVAEIMTAMDTIITENIPHGEIWVGFTPDEEIGEGADFFDLKNFGATYAYTVDGGDVNALEYENFNAAGAEIAIKGVSVHPGSAKDIMVNAALVGMELHSLLPEAMRPENTEGYEGFFHLTSFTGQVSSAKMSYIIRDHDHDLFEAKKVMLQDAVAAINKKYGDGTVTLTIKDSYYNMLEKIKPHMHLIENARLALKKAGLNPIDVPVRGGTDGARLSYDGLPCPNLGTGGCNFHGTYECCSIDKMDKAVEIILNLIEIYR